MKNSVRTIVSRTLGKIGLRTFVRRVEAIARPRRFAPTDPATPLAVERVLRMAAESGLAMRGDYYEFGIYRGFTFWTAQRVMTELGNESMRFIGLDSFAGLPAVRGLDAYKGDFFKGQFSSSDKYVRAMLDEHGVDWNRTVLVPGFYEETLVPELHREQNLRPAAVVLVDCDLYESASRVLRFLADGLLQDGTILIFDDWNAFDSDDDRGERRAYREFCAAHPEWKSESLFAYGSYGQVFRLRTTGAQGASRN